MNNTRFVGRCIEQLETQIELMRDLCRRNDAKRAAAELRISQHVATLAAVELYQPYDFKAAYSWHDLEVEWLKAPASYARTQALAVLLIIQHAMKEAP